MILQFLAEFTVNIYTVPLILLCFVSFGIGTVTLLRNRPSSLYFVFLLFTSLLSIWSLDLVLLLSTGDPALADFFGRALVLTIVVTPPVLFTFTCLLNGALTREIYPLTASYLGSLTLGVMTFSGTGIVRGVNEFSWGFYPQFGSLHYLYIGFFLLCMLKILSIFYREIANDTNESTHVQRNKTLLIGTIIGYLVAVDFLPAYGFSLAPFGYIFILAGLTIYAVAISEYNLSGLTDDRIASEIFMTIDEAVFVTDESGNIQLVNRSAEELLGLDFEDLQERNFKEFLERNELLEDLPGKTRESSRLNRESELTDTTGNKYQVSLKVTPFRKGTLQNDSSDNWYVFVVNNTTELKETQNQLDEVRFKNPITGLPNFEMLEKRHESDELPERCNQAAYVILKDLKAIKANLSETDNYSYLINTISSRLKACFSSEHFYHINENEFFVFSLNGQSLVESFRDHQDELTEPLNLGGQRIHINFSLGTAKDRPILDAYRYCQSTAVNDALDKPGTAIMQFSEEASEAHRQYFEIKHSLLEAIDEGEIKVNFHPQIAGGRIRGAEALLRWNHDQHGFIPPPKIVQAAIEMSYEKELLAHVLSESTREANDWHSDEVLAVNVSAKQLEYGDRLKRVIESTCRQQDFDPERLEIELTEQAAMRNLTRTRSILNELQELGVSVALDDFGTGYSSFKSLIELPVNILKIDKSFVLNLDENPENERIVETAQDIAETLGIQTVAEGVETVSHRDCLRDIGVDLMQGYYWTQPQPAEEYQEFRTADSLKEVASV